MTTLLFEDKMPEEINPEDLDRIIGREENQRLEFKKTYEHVENLEIAKDICSLANADGGYIIVGAEERDHTCSGFFSLSNADGLDTRIRQIHLDYVVERITYFRTKIISATSGATVLLIYVPDSFRKPHSVVKESKTEIWKRYGTDKRTMPIHEIREDVIKSSNAPNLIRIEKKIDQALKNIFVMDDRTPINKVTEDPGRLNDISDPDKFLNEIDELFSAHFSDKRYFRLTITPINLKNNLIDPSNKEFMEMLANPPNQRYSGWNIIPDSQIRVDSLGLRTVNFDYHHLRLTKSGHLEFWTQIDEEFCAEQREEDFQKHPKFYPYAVTEYPVSFLRFARCLYDKIGLKCFFKWRLQYWNIKECILLPYHPEAKDYLAPRQPLESYPYDNFKKEAQLLNNFEPDKSAFVLIKELYQAFGYTARQIPFFDEDGKFKIN